MRKGFRLGSLLWFFPLIFMLTLILSAPALAQESTQEPGSIAQEQPPEDGIALSGLILPIIAVLVVVVGILGFLWGKINGTNTDPRSPDQYATERLQLLQMNREAMTAQERAYQQASRTQQQAIDALTGVVRFVAPMTPFKSDDALGNYLEDLRKTGPPAPPQP